MVSKLPSVKGTENESKFVSPIRRGLQWS